METIIVEAVKQRFQLFLQILQVRVMTIIVRTATRQSPMKISDKMEVLHILEAVIR